MQVVCGGFEISGLTQKPHSDHSGQSTLALEKLLSWQAPVQLDEMKCQSTLALEKLLSWQAAVQLDEMKWVQVALVAASANQPQKLQRDHAKLPDVSSGSLHWKSKERHPEGHNLQRIQKAALA